MENGTLLNSSPERELVKQLEDSEYRKAFVEGHATDTIAFQLRAMRKSRGWEQKDVAEKLGNRKLQPMISRYENPDYGKYSISTLLELASAFDVALAVRFVEFSELVEWDLSTDRSKERPASFTEDHRLEEIVMHGLERQSAAAASAAIVSTELLRGAAHERCEQTEPVRSAGTSGLSGSSFNALGRIVEINKRSAEVA